MAILAAVLVLLATALDAKTLQVGPDRAFKTPSQAAAAAEDGDTIEIAAGEYFDCAVWRASRLTITGPADPATPAVLSDAACDGKALFVVAGNDTTIRHLTFTRVRVPDGNGAGIRAEGRNLTVEHSRFVNNQVAILAGNQPAGSIALLDSQFERNGVCNGAHCLPSVLIGTLLGLRVERSVFTAGRGGEFLRAAAARTDILASRFADGSAGVSTAHVALAGGSIQVADSSFEKGPASTLPGTVMVLRDLGGPALPMTFQRNIVENNTARGTVFVHNLTGGAPVMEGNRLGAGVTELDSSGYWIARARAGARGAYEGAREVVGKAKRAVRPLLPF